MSGSLVRVLSYLVLAASAALATGALAIHLAIHRAYVDNERSLQVVQQTPDGPRDEIVAVPTSLGYQFSLDHSYEIFHAAFGTTREQIKFLTAFDGHDDKGHQFTVNASPEMTFLPPYFVATAADVAAWKADPEGLLVSDRVATPNGWKAGDRITVHHQHGDASGRISAVVGGMSPKVLFHPTQLDRFLPEDLRARARYVSFPVAPGDYKRAQAIVEAAFEQAGTPAWITDSHDYALMTLGNAPRPRTFAALAATFGLLFCVVVTSVRCSRLRALFACVFGATMIAVPLYMKFHAGGFEAGEWFLESIPIGLSHVAYASAVVIGGAIFFLIAAHVVALTKHAWIASTLLLAASVVLATSAICAHASFSHLRIDAGTAVPERADFIHLRDRNDFIRWIGVRSTTVAGINAHGARVDGTFPAPGEPGVVVGAALLAMYPGLDHGSVLMGRHRWPVTGVLHAPDSEFESEIWCDFAACASELGAKAPPVTNAPVLPLVSWRLSEYQRPFAIMVAALGVAMIFALVAAFRLARERAVVRTFAVGTAGILLLALVATLLAISGRTLSLGFPTVFAQVHVPCAKIRLP